MKKRLANQAKALRKNMTYAEIKLWNKLKGKQLGVKFRRQEPVGNYIADFICFDKKLLVEIDGSQHIDCKKDAERDKWFKNQGFTVLRFWNNEVLRHADVVAKAIYDEVTNSEL